MQRKEKNGVHWLEFHLLEGLPLKHAVFLRHGGLSNSEYSHLNMGMGLGDDEAIIAKNVSIALDTLNISNCYWAKQVHGIDAAIVDKNSSQCAASCDALITETSDLALLIKHADCQATLIYDPVEHRLANVHSGWKGSVHNIYANVIQHLVALGSQPANLLVCIGPSLCPKHAEFKNYRTELPESFWEFQVTPTYFDFWAISRKQLKECGVLDHHIEIAEISTYAHPTDYFSYRRDGKTGRHGTIAMLH